MSHTRLAAALLAAGSVMLVPASLASAPTPTPTPRPRLSGGFGRTPVATPETDGQSMADVVRAASAARRRRDTKAVAITNDSLVKDPKKGRVSTSQIKPESPAARPTGRADVPSAAAVPVATPAAAADEALWRDRAHAARKRVEDLKAEVAQLEAESKQLENDFYRWDDGQYRDRVIKPAWDKKREELETARKQLVQAETDLADLPEKARRAGALPGWLRE